LATVNSPETHGYHGYISPFLHRSPNMRNSFQAHDRHIYEPEIHMSSHLQKLLEPTSLKQVVANCANAIKSYGLDKFDAIAVSGTSGTLVGGILSLELGKPLIVVYQNATRYSPVGAQGAYSNKRYIIVDDFVFSGKTVRLIASEVLTQFPQAVPTAIFAYLDEDYRAPLQPLTFHRKLRLDPPSADIPEYRTYKSV